jgi:hypothetical protein
LNPNTTKKEQRWSIIYHFYLAKQYVFPWS